MITEDQQKIATALAAAFAPEDYKARIEEGTTKSGQPYSRTFTYVEDEKVMARLDSTFGPDGWDMEVEPTTLTPTVSVKVTIVAGGSKKQDFGYASNDAKEPLKDATTDGIRRVGRLFGIARDVYEGKVAPGGGQIAPAARNSAPVAPQPQNTAPTPLAAAQAVFGDEARIPQPGDPCPKHPTERLIAGRDATGPDGLYHQDGLKPDGKRNWCSPYRQPRQRR